MANSPSDSPVLWIIAGVNGAGKTTFYEQKLRHKTAAEFVNADVMERERWPTQVGKHSLQAQQLAAERRDALLAERKSFITETVFSHPSKLDLINQAKAAGYRVELIHINVRNADVAIKRIDHRVSKGGHDVPDEKVRGRYPRTLKLVQQAMQIADRTRVYDNSALGRPHKYVMTLEQGRATKIGENLPQWAREQFKQELAHIAPARLNPAAASFADAKDILARQAGAEAAAALRIAAPNRTYRGPIVAETRDHYVQATGDRQTPQHIAHFKSRLAITPKLGDPVEIRYGSKTNRQASVTTLAVDKEAAAFVDAMRQLRADVDARASAGGGRRPKAALSDQQRELLVRASEAAHADTGIKANSAAHKLASYVATSLASLDHPKSNNPFKNETLASTYADQQQQQHSDKDR